MDINWFTFAAQIINFLVLAALLKRFLYGPIVRAMDQREQQIAQRARDAEAMRREAEQQASQYRDQQQQLQHQREALLTEAAQEVESWRRERLREAREEVQHAKQEWHEAVRRQRAAMVQELARRATGQVLQTASNVLAHLAGVDLEQQIIDAFLQRLGDLQQDELELLGQAMNASHHRITVASGFELSVDQQRRIRAAVHRRLSVQTEITFHTDRELICGVELRAADHKIAWNIQGFLQSLEEEFDRALDSAVATEPAHDLKTSAVAANAFHAASTAGAEQDA